MPTDNAERQRQFDISSLHFYATCFREQGWELRSMASNVFSTTLDEIAERLAAKQPDPPPVSAQELERILGKLAAHAVYSDIPLTGKDVDELRSLVRWLPAPPDLERRK